MLSLLLDVGLDDSRLVDGTGFHTLDALERSADWHSCAGGSINLRAQAGAGKLEVCRLWQPVAASCGPYKKISGQICSILPWLLEV